MKTDKLMIGVVILLIVGMMITFIWIKKKRGDNMIAGFGKSTGKSFKVHGYYSDGYVVVEVEINKSGDGLRWRERYAGKITRPKYAEIEYYSTGRAYFVAGKRIYYLENFLKN